MTQIDFYIHSDSNRSDRLLTACRLAQKIYEQQLKAYILADDEAVASQLDKLLWTFRDKSFIPHGISDQSDASVTPILIGWDNSGGHPHDDVLINLSHRVPETFSRYHRVVEIIDHHEETRSHGRERFKFYKSRGYPMETHNI